MSELLTDAKCLLQYKSVFKKWNWKLSTPVHQWHDVSISTDQRIVGLSLWSIIDTNKDHDYSHIFKNVQFPTALRSLSLGANNLTFVHIQHLNCPASLHTLDLYGNSLGPRAAAGLRLPPLLKKLILSQNNIGDVGASSLRLPTGLEVLSLEHNNIRNQGAASLRLPPSLLELNLSHNWIGNKGAQALRLPPGLLKLDISYNYNLQSKGVETLRLPSRLTVILLDDEKRKSAVINSARSVLGKRRYTPVLRAYVEQYPDFYAMESKKLWSVICRGIKWGRTQHPIMKFLKSVPGSRNIRKTILEYFNPFLHE